jgi:hypothetical protein
MFVATVMLLLHVIVTNTHPLRLSLIRLNLLLLVSDLRSEIESQVAASQPVLNK